MTHVESARGPDRFLLGIILGAAVLVVAAVALVAFGRPAPALPADPESPVGVVQAYIQAVQAGDVDRAYGYLSSNAQAALPLNDYRKTFARGPFEARVEQRLVIEPVSETPTRAEVKVTISRMAVNEGPFSAATYHDDVTVVLVRQDNGWRIDVPAEPYPFFA
jgi:hypothetical protein